MPSRHLLARGHREHLGFLSETPSLGSPVGLDLSLPVNSQSQSLDGPSVTCDWQWGVPGRAVTMGSERCQLSGPTSVTLNRVSQNQREEFT